MQDDYDWEDIEVPDATAPTSTASQASESRAEVSEDISSDQLKFTALRQEGTSIKAGAHRHQYSREFKLSVITLQN